MERKHALGGKPVKKSVVDHRLRARMPLLAGLEYQKRDAVEVARVVEITRGREQHRRMAVVAAAVHAPVVPGPVGDVVLLLHRQRIHVGAKPDTPAARVDAARNDRDNAGTTDAGVMFDRPRRQLVTDEPCRTVLFEAELGMRVEVAAEVGERIGPAPDVFDRIGGRHGRCGR